MAEYNSTDTSWISPSRIESPSMPNQSAHSFRPFRASSSLYQHDISSSTSIDLLDISDNMLLKVRLRRLEIKNLHLRIESQYQQESLEIQRTINRQLLAEGPKVDLTRPTSRSLQKALRRNSPIVIQPQPPLNQSQVSNNPFIERASNSLRQHLTPPLRPENVTVVKQYAAAGGGDGDDGGDGGGDDGRRNDRHHKSNRRDKAPEPKSIKKEGLVHDTTFVQTHCRKEKKAPCYNGLDRWSEYLLQFEIVARQNAWDKTRMAEELATSLEMKAQAVLADFPAGTFDYDSLVTKLEQLR